MHLSELRVWLDEEAHFSLLLWHLSLATSQAKLAIGPGYPFLVKRNLGPTPLHGPGPPTGVQANDTEKRQTLGTDIRSGSVCSGAKDPDLNSNPVASHRVTSDTLVPLARRAPSGRVHSSWATQLSRRQMRQGP